MISVRMGDNRVRERCRKLQPAINTSGNGYPPAASCYSSWRGSVMKCYFIISTTEELQSGVTESTDRC